MKDTKQLLSLLRHTHN